MQKNHLAIDIGASSGRHIVGWMENGVLRTEEVYRFPNSVRRVDGHLEWDIDSLFAHVKQGILMEQGDAPFLSSGTWSLLGVKLAKTSTGQHWDKLYIAGGGAKNAALNELTAHYTGKQVVALPIEATAIGNLKIQMSISEGGTL